jgi:hypothetical protein
MSRMRRSLLENRAPDSLMHFFYGLLGQKWRAGIPTRLSISIPMDFGIKSCLPKNQTGKYPKDSILEVELFPAVSVPS